MNIFEDLIEELKEENLIEETVIETRQISKTSAVDPSKDSVKTNGQSVTDVEQPVAAFILNENSNESAAERSSEKSTPPLTKAPVSISEQDAAPVYDLPENLPPVGEKEFYRKRAMEEITGLQMVEHVISGVEREQMKVIPKNYDDLAAKKSLHAFLQVPGDAKSPEHAQAEFALMQETENWYSALSHRDRRISVAHLRRYCETTRPPLSSQALISLARFYRNSPFSESVRSKFDLVITRLFTKDIGNEKRVMVFTRDEVIEHLKELYAEWASIQLYSAKEDDSEIVLAAMKFEDFMSEAEHAESFDELVENDFFNRLRLFKENSSEYFYAPLITATAIECNIRIGNKYVDLIETEREKTNSGQMQDKYGFLHDQAISDAASKTLQLVELLKERVEIVENTPVEETKEIHITEAKPEPEKIYRPIQTETAKKRNLRREQISTRRCDYSNITEHRTICLGQLYGK